MRKISCLFILVSSILFTSCIEIIDDILIHDDGSGVFKYTVNLSSSKVKINSILALDSLKGKRVPELSEIKEKIYLFKKSLSNQKGISNVLIEENYTDFIFKFSCNFSSPGVLQTGIENSIAEISENQVFLDPKYKWIQWDGNVLSRTIPDITSDKLKTLDSKDDELLKLGTYTAISRFDRKIEKFDNPNAKLSKSLTATMLKVDTYSLKENENLLDNRIFLSKIKN
ncbi:MAG: hypothetical protein RL037_2194 [Bacteroidota bacterium]